MQKDGGERGRNDADRIEAEAAAVESRFERWRGTVGLFVGPALGLLIYLLPGGALSPAAHRLGAVLALVGVYWITEAIPIPDKTFFGLILPYPTLEPAEYIKNTSEFLQGALSAAIDSGNTGNIVLFSNRLKFESRLAEDAFNQMLVESLKVFLAVPEKNDNLRLLDGHIDYEDFNLYLSRPFFNHFTYFEYDSKVAFEKQLRANPNPLLLAPEAPIEALFLLEVPQGGDPTVFYDILQYFAEKNVSPVYSVVENPDREEPFVTVSLLYSRKPAELLQDFNRISEEHAKAKVRKSMEQLVELPILNVNLESEAKRVARQRGGTESDILVVLRRLGKL